MKVLVIEDEHKIATSIKKGLEQESYVVDVAYDGIRGFDLAEGEPYDVIVLDLMLPGMDGMTLCKKLRQEGVHTPVLMLTAKGQLEDKVQGLDSGADDYLVKPFAFSELVARIRALTRRQSTNKSTILTVGDLSLNTATYEVKRAGKRINLSRKEFSLLEYFMRHAGKIMNKEQIIENVWSYESDILPNTIEVYIGYLRRKLRDKKSLIHTIRGFGYTLEN